MLYEDLAPKGSSRVSDTFTSSGWVTTFQLIKAADTLAAISERRIS